MYFSELMYKIYWRISCYILLPLATIILNAKIISLSTNYRITDQLSVLPAYPVGLILGSGTTSDPSSINYSFASRMDKGSELYRSGKIKRIIVSGVSNKPYYNEPNDMKSALVELGVPANSIYPDHGGLRTFLSIKRAYKDKKVRQVIVISQRKQLERAIFIARCLGMDAWGLEADALPYKESSGDRIHELLARVRCIIDCIFNC